MWTLQVGSRAEQAEHSTKNPKRKRRCMVRMAERGSFSLVNVAAVQPDGVPRLGRNIREREELIRPLRRPRELRGTGEPKHEQVEHQAVVLHDEAGELQAADEAVRVGVRHVLV